MDTEERELAEPPEPITGSVSTEQASIVPQLESVTKITTVFLLAAYVAGYLIVSIYESSFGFTELNPLKPKILSAGILFSGLTFIPSYIARRIYSQPFPATRRVATALSLTIAYLYACSVAAGGLSLITSQKPEPGPLSKLPIKSFIMAILPGPQWIYSLAVILISMILFLLVIKAKLISKPPSSMIATSLLLLVINTSLLLFSEKVYGSAWIELWFFSAGLIFWALAKIILNTQKRKVADWAAIISIPICALFCFERWVYPKVQSSWGGGRPVPVVLYLTKDSPLRPGESLPALLLAESENGFYFVEDTKSQAVFMPRAQVSMISFSDKLPTTPPGVQLKP